MKIIKRGVPEAEKRYRATCRSCGSVIEYKHSEILKIDADYRETAHDLGNCPVCFKDLVNYNTEPYKEKSQIGSGYF